MYGRNARRGFLVIAFTGIFLAASYIGVRSWPPPPSYSFLKGQRPVSKVYRKAPGGRALIYWTFTGQANFRHVETAAAKDLLPLGFKAYGGLAAAKVFELTNPSTGAISSFVAIQADFKILGKGRASEPAPGWVGVAIISEDPVPIWLRDLVSWPG